MSRCPKCLIMISNKSNICPCSCNHQYEKKTTKLLLQPTNNHYTGLVCKTCGNIENEKLENPKPTFSKTNDYIFQFVNNK